MTNLTITLTEEQLLLIQDAVEYLWRHCIGQPDFKSFRLEEWADEKKEFKNWHTLLDIWKVISTRNYFDKWWEENTSCVHSYRDVYKMWEYPLITIKKDD